MSTSTDKFRRHVRAMQGVYARLDSGQLTGRNADGTQGTLNYHYREAAATLATACELLSDELPEYLDSAQGRRLAEAWTTVERRYYGLDRLSR